MNGNLWRARWTASQISGILQDQHQGFWKRPLGVVREQIASVEAAARTPHAVIVSGLRRAGKSTLLAQMAHRLGQEHVHYVSFDDDRFLGFDAGDADTLLGALIETFGDRPNFVLDEVQNAPGWERFVRRWIDQGFKLYITGSNAALLSRELGTRLTGRYIPIELFPFSFVEYQRWRETSTASPRVLTTRLRAHLNRDLLSYLRQGGIPEPLQYPQLPLRHTLYDDVINRDIVIRNRIEDPRALRELSFQLISNPASFVSYNKLKQQLGLGSTTTIKNYVQHLEDGWLLHTTNVFDASVKRQQIAPKKIYCIDTGLTNAVGFQVSPNIGRQLENLVYLHLRRTTSQIYYYTTHSGFEVDLFVPGQRLFVQIAQHISEPGVYEREARALREAIAEVNGSRGLLLTMDAPSPPQIKHEPFTISGIAEWLLTARS